MYAATWKDTGDLHAANRKNLSDCLTVLLALYVKILRNQLFEISTDGSPNSENGISNLLELLVFGFVSVGTLLIKLPDGSHHIDVLIQREAHVHRHLLKYIFSIHPARGHHEDMCLLINHVMLMNIT